MIDCFLFFNELDLLEIRLNAMASYVERFILCECPVTFTGIPKPLHFEENKDRFKDFNITHLIADDYKSIVEKHNPWLIDYYQRDTITKELETVPPEELVMMSDLDEFPDISTWNGKEGSFKHMMYYYWMNAYNPGHKNWHGTLLFKKKNIPSFNLLRGRRGQIEVVGLGWHFSHLGTVDNIIYKISASSHTELNTSEITDNIEHNRMNLIDPYNRHTVKMQIADPSGPQWLLEHRDRYPHFFYREDT